ncbi:hypothetical protein GAY28_34420 [Azospirillum brasilense]|nr:hypothetical protein [Azospirillum brasilense]
MEAILDKAFDKPSRGSEAPVVARAGDEDTPRAVAKGRPPAKPGPLGPPASTVSTPAAVRPPARARDEDADTTKADGSKWGVQVGAFSTREASKRALTQATKQAPFLLRAAKPAVTPVKANGATVYRARMVGLDEGTARKVCSELTRNGHRCVPVSPNEKL